jgi:hypothetical protein
MVLSSSYPIDTIAITATPRSQTKTPAGPSGSAGVGMDEINYSRGPSAAL